MSAAADRHGRVSELLGVFALHAVDGSESEIVDAHLEECPRCRAEVDELREVAAELANAPVPPSGLLWDRIAGRLAQPPGQSPAGGTALDGASHPTQTGALGDIPEHLDPVAGRPMPHGRPMSRSRRAGRRRGPLWALGCAAVACAALAAVLGLDWSSASGRASQLQHTLARRGVDAAVEAALVSPGHRIVELRSISGTPVAELVVRRSGVGYVVTSRLPVLPTGQTYQLWMETADRPISVGLLGAKPGPGDAFGLGSSVGRARELIVTVEPSGGVATPDAAPVASATVT